jgi:hypothetical protein
MLCFRVCRLDGYLVNRQSATVKRGGISAEGSCPYNTVLCINNRTSLMDNQSFERAEQIWEHPKQTKMVFMKKLRTVWSQGLLAIIQCRYIKIKIHAAIIVLVVLYEFETCSHWGRNVGWGCSRIRCWGIFGPRRDGVIGEWRRLHKWELYDTYFSPNIILVIKSRRMRWAGHVTSMEERYIKGFFLGGGAVDLGEQTTRNT